VWSGGDSDSDSDGDSDSDSDVDTDSIECNLGEYDGGLVVATQSDLVALTGYISLSGSLRITCPLCTDLDVLICLTSISSLTVWDNPILTSLEGLNNITTMSSDFMPDITVIENPVLTNIDGLEGITGPVGSILISDNDNLTNLDGLDGITAANSIHIHDNSSLNSLIGLETITGSVGITIGNNSSLISLEGLGGITDLGEYGCLGIYNNDALISLEGLSGLTWVDDEFVIWDNNILPDCEACAILSQLTTVPTVEVYDNLDDTCTPVPANCP
jgi:hypothetical protein